MPRGRPRKTIGKSVLVEKPRKSKRVAKELKDMIEKAKPGRKAFAGYKATLIYNHGGTSVETEIRYERIKAKAIAKIIQRGPEGQIVKYKRIGPPGRMGYQDAQGNVYSKDEVRAFQEIGGKEVEVAPLHRTTSMEVTKVIDNKIANEFLPESYYVIWGSPSALMKVAKSLGKDKTAVVRFTFGGFKEYYGFLRPVTKDGKFAIEMTLSRSMKEHERWMTTKAAKAEAKIVRPKLLEEF